MDALATIALIMLTTLSGSTSVLAYSVMIFILGAGMGLVMQTIVLAVQNAVDPHEIGIATSTNNYFREIGAAIGVSFFGTIFTSRLVANLAEVFAGAPGSGGRLDQLTPQLVQSLPEPLKSGVVDAYASALAPTFWYLVPFAVVGLLLALLLREIKLSSVAAMVARGEAVAAVDPHAAE